jgi:hypothetical protein
MRLLLLAVLLLAGAPALADLQLKSGEHAGFSRIVVYMDQPRDWRLGRIGADYGFVYGGSPTGLQMAGLFDLIPRDRVADVTHEAARNLIRFRLNCDCHADAFDLRGGHVALDFKDGPPGPRAPFEAPVTGSDGVPISPASPAPDGFHLPAIATDTPVPAVSPPGDAAPPAPDPVDLSTGREADRTDAPSRTAPLLPPESLDPASALTASLAQSLDRQTALDDMRNDLVQQMARAMSQGLVEPVGPRAPAVQPAPEVHAADTAGEEQPTPDAATGPTGHPLSAATRVDLDTRRQLPQGTTGGICTEDDVVEALSARDTSDPASGIAALRGALVDARLIPSAEGHRALAEYYVALGLGAEALLVLQAAGPALANGAPELAALARVLIGARFPDTTYPASQLDCPGPVAVWAALARTSLPDPLPPAARAAILAGFSAQTPMLRAVMAPDLTDKFRGIGDRDAVESLTLALDRAGGQHADPLTAALDALAADNWSRARSELATLARGTGDAALRAAMILAEEAAARDDPLDAATRDDLQAWAFESGASDAGLRLRAALAVVRALADDWPGAEATFATSPQPPSVVGTRTLRQLSGIAAGQADPADFAGFVYRNEAALFRALDAPTRRAVALRLGELGLTDALRRVLEGSDPALPPTASLLAAAALDDGDAARALAFLDAANIADAAEGRLRALWQLGATADLGRILASAPDTDLSAALLWRIGRVADLPETAPGPYGQARALLASRPGAVAAPDPDTVPSVAALTSLRDQIAARRAVHEEVLALFPRDDD